MNVRWRPGSFCLLFAAVAAVGSTAHAVTEQTASNVFSGRPYLYVEAENYSTLTDGGTAGNGWTSVNTASPITTAQGRSILPATSNVSGTAMLDNIGGGIGEDSMNYEVKFITAGTYQFYLRHTMFDSAAVAGNFGNEDSILLSSTFNKNATTDWVGFQGPDWNIALPNTDAPTPGFALDPDGFESKISDSFGDGWLAIRDWHVKSEGVLTINNNANDDFWNGQFHWYNRPVFVKTTANSYTGFADDFGFKTEYTVTAEQVGQTLTFQIANREQYGVIDGFMFIKDDANDLLDDFSQAALDVVLPVEPDADFNASGGVDGVDYAIWTGGFGTGATKATGDADSDGDVDGRDFLVWQRQASFPMGGAAGVPEPGALGLAAIAALTLAGARSQRRRA